MVEVCTVLASGGLPESAGLWLAFLFPGNKDTEGQAPPSFCVVAVMAEKHL